MTSRIWETRAHDDAQAVALERELRIAPVTARLLAIRGLSDLDIARRFLSPSLDDLHDPFRLAGMHEADERILRSGREAAAEREGGGAGQPQVLHGALLVRERQNA